MARDFYASERFYYGPGGSRVEDRPRSGGGTVQQIETRIGDPERDVTREHLSWAFSNGYLNREEFNERTDQVNGARAAHELKAIVVDLPKRPKVDEVIAVVTKKEKRTFPNVFKIWWNMHPSFKVLSFMPLSLTMAIATPISLLAGHSHVPGLVTFAAVTAICVGAATTLIEIIGALACIDDF